MNTISHILAMVACGWLADQFYNARGEPILAAMCVGFLIFFIVAAIPAVDTDWQEFVGRRGED